MNQPKFMTFEEWLREQPEEIQEMKSECDRCDGSGECECSCGDIHDCSKCDGSGEIKGGAKEQRKLYAAAKQADLEKWNSFFGLKEAA